MRRRSPIVLLLVVVWLVFLAWIAWGYVAVRGSHQPTYSVREQGDGYEIREYPHQLVAQVTVRGSWADAFKEGSRMLASYAGGNNVDQAYLSQVESIASDTEIAGIRMDADTPVLLQEKGDVFLISLVLPEEYSASTLPRPNDPEIRILEQAPATVAVRTFSGRVDAKRAQEQERALRELLQRDKRVIVAAAKLARYHPAWTPAFMQRNEVMIAIRSRP